MKVFYFPSSNFNELSWQIKLAYSRLHYNLIYNANGCLNFHLHELRCPCFVQQVFLSILIKFKLI